MALSNERQRLTFADEDLVLCVFCHGCYFLAGLAMVGNVCVVGHARVGKYRKWTPTVLGKPFLVLDRGVGGLFIIVLFCYESLGLHQPWFGAYTRDSLPNSRLLNANTDCKNADPNI
jgi:hypothetical protein